MSQTMVVYLVAYGYTNRYAGAAVNPNERGSCEVILRASAVKSREKLVAGINGAVVDDAYALSDIYPKPFSTEVLRRFKVGTKYTQFSEGRRKYKVNTAEALEKRRIILPNKDILWLSFDSGEELKALKSMGEFLETFGVGSEDEKKMSLSELAKEHNATKAIAVVGKERTKKQTAKKRKVRVKARARETKRYGMPNSGKMASS